ncbi:MULTISPECIES: hypothetical protein [Caproicibacterium]|jgi:DNA-directed RNA polymerase subunit RPC12/RpoP|uniref:Uncharacterized protein n=1 Tax=Caproicibacterium lactatifermentans TaxID=2666138 RepID=A0A859DME7_9FIRM|nr:hypothetical protein [Caproicibacterium lactatifermentans]MDD4807232.1 hypothetical protein [Oscillospiraceae bacterium]QKN23008.1 hypothetical protein GJQ69_00035 [Caproicibacterium lactatifermentans]
MKQNRGPRCPYCGKKVNPLIAFVLKNRGEYRCTKCKGISNIHLNAGIYRLAVVMVLAAAAVLLIEEVFVRHFTWYSPPLVFLPFLIFYLLSARYVELRRPVIPRRPVKRRAPNSITGGFTSVCDHKEEPTVSVPSLYDRPVAVYEESPEPVHEDPTIQMGQIDEMSPVPPLRTIKAQKQKQEKVPEELLHQFEENLGEEAEPVFYKKTDAKTPSGKYHSYRAPLEESEENPHENP